MRVVGGGVSAKAQGITQRVLDVFGFYHIDSSSPVEQIKVWRGHWKQGCACGVVARMEDFVCLTQMISERCKRGCFPIQMR